MPPESLDGGECHIWLVSPDDFASRQRDLDCLLSDADQAMVERQRSPESRSLTRLSRGLLRVVLARYLDEDPRELDVDRTCPECGEPHGRPRVRGAGGLHVSVAHCSHLLVLALHTAPVGVDVESVPERSDLPSEDLLSLALTSGERGYVAQADGAERWRRFLRYWTYKEAVLKSLGTGLAMPLTEVVVRDGDRGGQVELNGQPESGLWVRPLELGARHVAALATIGEVEVSRVRRAGVALLPDLGGR